MRNLIKNIIKKKEPNWTECRCENCGSLHFEVDSDSYKKGSVKVKCRKCKVLTQV